MDPYEFNKPVSPVGQSSIADHGRAIADLARATGRPAAVVAQMYWSELSRLAEQATIGNYLGLLTQRKVKQALIQAA